ncbi:hypothetical protein P8452_53551 [Trifolium repens]|nr:hypothetical protein QL285_034935 [Trifolium repens]WJX69283.1 hypothetical protein P8452_53551 [Trifolium repens]
MENNETTSPPKHDGRTKAIDENSDPNSISKIKMEEKMVKKINQDICEITERITKKVSIRDDLDQSALNRLKHRQWYQTYRVATKEKILRDLYMALDEMNFMSNKAANEGWFEEKLDKNSMNYLKLLESKSLAKEKQILKDINFQQKEKDVASFKSLEVLKESILNYRDMIFYYRKVKSMEQSRQNHYLNGWQKLVKEIEQFQIQLMERAIVENISNYESLKKTIKDQIKFLCDMMKSGTRVKYGAKEIDAINGEIYSLRAKLIEKYNKKDEAYQRILKLKQNCIM